MQAELNSDVALLAANALLSHLRKNPDAAAKPAGELAATFGLEESFVTQVLQGIQSTRRVEVRPVSTKPSSLQVFVDLLRRVWMRASARPTLFVVVSSVAAALMLFTLARFGGASGNVLWGLLLVAGIVGATLFLHMAVYFRHRRARNAVWGALVLFGAMLLPASYAMLRDPSKVGGPGAAFILLLIATMGILFIACAYAGFGSLAAVLGGWTTIKFQERAEESLSRQDLLERYFELQNRLRLSVYPRSQSRRPGILSHRNIVWYRDHQFWPNIFIGFVLTAVQLIAFHATGLKPGQTQSVGSPISPWFPFIMAVGIASILFRVGQGYVSRSGWQAALGAICLNIGSSAAKLALYQDLSFSVVTVPGFIGSELLDTLMMVGISCAAYLGSVVQRWAAREASLQQNDQAALLAEMVRIQWKLSNEAAAVCVLVVDAAKSSEMKAAADPLAVEYTFREYQEWIQRVCAARSGRVLSTAGDGAVVAFDSCDQALSAARRVQTDLFQFNKDVNRLAQPFRLRIGLHTGEVVGDINEVQFTEVIDIAAHIEAVCPVGGIAASHDVAQRLPDEKLLPLSTEVDGHGIFIVANPSEFE